MKITAPNLYLVNVSHYIALKPKALSPITETPHSCGLQVRAEISAGIPIPMVPNVAASNFLRGY